MINFISVDQIIIIENWYHLNYENIEYIDLNMFVNIIF